MSQAQALKRILKELSNFNKEETEDICAGPIDDSDMFHWEASINGPEDSPYNGGVFQLEIEFPKDYPFRSPRVEFVTKIFHPSVRGDGRICCHAAPIRDNWSPELSIVNILQSIQKSLKSPDRNCYENEEAHTALENCKFDEIAKNYTDLYAIE